MKGKSLYAMVFAVQQKVNLGTTTLQRQVVGY